MKTAVLHIAERNRFEVHSLPSKGINHSSVSQKWYMKANHPVEAHRWAEAISKSIEWYKQRDNANDSDASSINASRRRSMESDNSGIRSTPSMQSQSLSTHLWRKSAPGSNGRDHDSMTGSTYTFVDSADASPNMMQNDGVGPSTASHHTIENDGGDEDNDEEDSSSANSDRKTPPHTNFELQGSATFAQLDLCAQLASNLSLPRGTSDRAIETHQALTESLRTTQSLLNDYLRISREREEWWARQLKKERARQQFWEESLATVVKEGEVLEKELRTRSRKRGSRIFGPSAMGSLYEKKRPSALGLTPTSSTMSPPLIEEPPSPQAEGPPPPSAPAAIPKYSPPPPLPVPSFAVSPPTPIDPLPQPAAKKSPLRSPEMAMGRRPSPISLDETAFKITKDPFVEDYEHDTDDEDEFFDAIESNNLPNLYINEGLKSPASEVSFSPTLAAEPSPAELLSMATLKGPLPKGTNLEQYSGYAHLRSRLAIGSDQRPSTSLWSVLKHSIGKDLTKISFPVFFNEPTSMLQRMVCFLFGRSGLVGPVLTD